jgi:uncharacterized membrane protein
MPRKKPTPERLGAFSDGVIAVIITIMVLELKPPASSSLGALLPLWPTFASYLVSYTFVGIVWVNHHHMLRFQEIATPRLIWANLGLLFSVSLVPFATTWVADTRLAYVPVALYAGVFCLVNLTYILFELAILDQPDAAHELADLVERSKFRSNATLVVYFVAGLLALRFRVLGFVLIVLNTLVYLLPDRFTARSVHEVPAQPPF